MKTVLKVDTVKKKWKIKKKISGWCNCVKMIVNIGVL